jgi:F1F0 ATPase subunit 2
VERIGVIETVATLLACLVAGVALGLIFFGGLWWTLQRVPQVRHPGLLVAASLALRSAVVMTGLFLVFDDQLERLGAALLGVFAVRAWLRRRIGAQIADSREARTKEA